MAGEVQEDQAVASTDSAFEINVHNVIQDTVSGSLAKRFAANGKLASDFACLDPKNFPEIKEKGLPSTSLQQISKCLLQFDDSATVSTLQAELCSLASQWERLKKSPLEGFTVRAGDEMEEEPEIESRVCSSCRNCAICVYQTLSQYNLFTDACHAVGVALTC